MWRGRWVWHPVLLEIYAVYAIYARLVCVMRYQK
jgi:hypothetical protein